MLADAAAAECAATIGRLMQNERRSYTLEQARALVTPIRSVLLQIAIEKRRLDQAVADLHALLTLDGDPSNAELGRQQAEVTLLGEGITGLLQHLETLGLELRDPDAGLVDIPTERDGEAAWFCWRLADPDLAFWHSTRDGFATRRPV